MPAELILDFSDTNDLRTLRVYDTSLYNPKVDVECGLLEVTPPGYIESINFNVTEGFSLILNSSNLNLAKVKTRKDLQSLPDGIYTFKYSVKPSGQLWVEYDWLRNNKLIKDYYTKWCELKLQPYPESKQVKEQIRHLREVESYIITSKLEVEQCGNRQRGMDLYKYAYELLNIGCKTCH